MSQPVECHSEYKYAQRPVALHWEGKRLEIEQIETTWRSPVGIFFRVCTSKGIFELTYDPNLDTWKIIQP
jgi:hypothetical protein